MCGILNLNTDEFISSEQITKMNDRMVHRGPDADGIFIENNIWLGHRRL